MGKVSGNWAVFLHLMSASFTVGCFFGAWVALSMIGGIKTAALE
jgi:hypothetical protein